MYFWESILAIWSVSGGMVGLFCRKYDVFNSIQFILIVFWGKAWLCLPPRSPDMNTRTGLAPRTLPVHLMTGLWGEMIISLSMNITMNQLGGASVIAKFHS